MKGFIKHMLTRVGKGPVILMSLILTYIKGMGIYDYVVYRDSSLLWISSILIIVMNITFFIDYKITSKKEKKNKWEEK